MPDITAFGAGGVVKLTSYLGEVTRELDKQARIRTFAAANAVKREWVKGLSGSRSGRVYRVPGTSQTYVASAPGEAPAVATRDFRLSIKAVSERNAQGDWEGVVGSDMEKAPWLEFGTGRAGAAGGQLDLPSGYSHGGSSGMAPRPSLRPALERSRGEVERILGRRMG